LDSIERLITELIGNEISVWWQKELKIPVGSAFISPNEYFNACNNNFKQLGANILRLTKENETLKSEIEKIKNELSKVQETNAYASPLVSISNKKSNVLYLSEDIVDSFNNWAREPTLSLPAAEFNYAEGELKLREKQVITKTSNSNSLWIINKSGTKKYLFPNPNMIDQIGGTIDAIYGVKGKRRAKGQNKVCIQKACEIKEGGWIEFKGELVLL